MPYRRALFACIAAILLADVLAIANTSAATAPPMTRARVIAALAARIDEQTRTANYSIDYGVAPSKSSVTAPIASVAGVADFRANRYTARITSYEDVRNPQTVDVFISVGPNPYPNLIKYHDTGVLGLQWVRQGGDWARPSVVAFGDLGSPVPELGVIGHRFGGDQPGYAHRGADRRAIIEAFVSRIEDRGVERRHGAGTRHVRVTFDANRGKRELSPELAREMATWAENLDGDADIWIDARGHLVGLAQRAEWGDGAESIVFTQKVEVWSLGTAPSIDQPRDLPPPDFDD